MAERKLLSPRVASQAHGVERSADSFIRKRAPQVVPQRFPLLPKARLREFQEPLFVRDGQRGSCSGKRHAHERGSDPRRRAERAGRNPQNNFRFRIELADRRKIAVITPAGCCNDPRCHFPLNHNVNRCDLIGPLEQPMKDRRRDVVRQIAVDAKSIARNRPQIDLQHVFCDHFNAGPLCRIPANSALQVRRQSTIRFNGDDPTIRRSEKLRHFAVPRPNLDPRFTRVSRERFEDPPSPAGIA